MNSITNSEVLDSRLENAINNVYIHKVNPYKDSYKESLYADLYNGFLHVELFSLLHGLLIDGLKDLLRKSSDKDGIVYVHADQSRRLICVIDSLSILQKAFEISEYSFEIDDCYTFLFTEIREQLSDSNGSYVKDSESIRTCCIPYAIPICRLKNSIVIAHNYNETANLSLIGSGSYANVYKFHDNYYDEDFAVKQLLDNQDSKTKSRFTNEFKKLKELNSPYILDVFCFDSKKTAFVMECMDGSVEQLCQKDSLTKQTRNSIAKQICMSVKYLHSKGLCHRDIAAQNFLYREYDDTVVIKMADLGIVKDPSEKLSSSGTKVKGRYVDPEIEIIGFENFKQIHDIYPLSLLIAFVLTGKFSGYSEEYPLIDKMIKKVLQHSFKTVDELLSYCKEEGLIK